jgi:protein FAM50
LSECSLISAQGNTVGEFLKAVREQLSVDYREMRTASVENLIYIKEDLIIPHVRNPKP